MIFLILSIILSTLIFVCFKLFQRFNINNLQAVTINYLVGAAFGLLLYQGDYSWKTIHEQSWFYLAVVEGFLFIAVFMLFASSSQKAGVAVTAVASKMSVVIPVILGIVLYSEQSSTLKITGILIALVAFYLTFRKGNHFSGYKRFIILPLLLFLGNGAVDSIMKYTQHNYLDTDGGLFLSVVFIVALIFGLLATTVNVSSGSRKIRFRNIIGGLILGFLNYATTYFMILAMDYMESSVLFPVLNSGIVMLSAIIGFSAFSEKLNPINIAGIALSVFAIFLIFMS